MSTWWFPDNTVLCNFAAVRSLPLLEKVLESRGRWTEAVAFECSRSARYYPDLRNVAEDGWLGDPVEIVQQAEQEAVERARRAYFGGDRSAPFQHLGEAQTCVLLERRAEFSGSVWITDDRAAAEFARGKGITTQDTMDLVSSAVVDGLTTPQQGFDLLHKMLESDRYLHRTPRNPDDLRR